MKIIAVNPTTYRSTEKHDTSARISFDFGVECMGFRSHAEEMAACAWVPFTDTKDMILDRGIVEPGCSILNDAVGHGCGLSLYYVKVSM
jgi:hypothetical protein